MTDRIDVKRITATAFQAAAGLAIAVKKAGADAGLDNRLVELIKIRASQLNGCAYCLEMHHREARDAGESQRRLDLVTVWRETELYSAPERIALEITESLTALSATQDLPDELYERALACFGPEQLSAVIWAVTAINMWNRLGVACRLPLPA